jgi:hypothetical protein
MNRLSQDSLTEFQEIAILRCLDNPAMNSRRVADEMNHGLSDQVRARAKVNYVSPAVSRGKSQFSISVKEFLRELESEGFPSNHARQVCSALTGGKFLRENEIQIESIDGPPSKTSTTVIVHYKFLASGLQSGGVDSLREKSAATQSRETPEEWAHRMTERLAGLMKDEIAAMGGGEAFLRWVRGYDEEEAL